MKSKKICLIVAVLCMAVSCSIADFSTALTNFPNGLAVNGVPIYGGGNKLFTTGTVYFVDSVNGSNTNSGLNTNEALATIEYTIENKVTTSKGDIVAVMPGHTETIDSVITWDEDDVKLIGLGPVPGSQVINISLIDINAFDMTGDDCIIENFRITHSSSGSTSQTEIFDVDATRVTFRDLIIDFMGSAEAEGINFGLGEEDNNVINVKFIEPAAGESCIVNFSSRTSIVRCEFDLSTGDGLAIENVASADGHLITGCLFASDGSDLDHITWLAAPGEGHKVFWNFAFNNNADASCFGATDTDLDTQFIGCFIGATNGSEAVYDPSP